MDVKIFYSFFDLNIQQQFLGLSLHKRWQLGLQKAGLTEVANIAPSKPVFLLLTPMLFSAQAWIFLHQQAQDVPAESVFILAPEKLLVLRTQNSAIINAIAQAQNAPQILNALAPLAQHKRIIHDKEKICYPLTRPDRAAQNWLLQTLVKDTEGFMSRHVERKISLTVTRAIINLPITPNHMSLISIAIGVLGSFLFASSEKWYHVVASVCFWLHSVLDGCDGEIARLKFQHSRTGALLDFWGDNIVHAFVFANIAIGLRQNTYAPLAGVAAVIFGLGCAALAYINTLRNSSSGSFQSVSGQSSTTSKILDALARRDFIYLVIALACVGRLHYFLYLSALGSTVYFFILLTLTLRSKKS